jgi:hypothetical protein
MSYWRRNFSNCIKNIRRRERELRTSSFCLSLLQEMKRNLPVPLPYCFSKPIKPEF